MAARFQARKKREPQEREMSVSRQDDDDDDDEVLSDVEPLPPSDLHQSSLVTRSWPSSPLAASHEVTAGLYRSLQRSRQREVIGHTAARPVSFMSSPDLRATPPLYSHGLEEAREADSSRDVIGSGVQEAGSEVESEADGRLHQMDLHLQKSLKRSAQRTSGRRHIEEMENVRTHLQSILRSTSTTPHRHEFGAPVSRHLLDESPDSDCTSHLLRSAVSLGEMDELFPLYSRLHVDSSRSVSELQVLRDSLERERSRRKVCEQQVASLQNKVLQVQQQFTLAVAADRKKDIMIEQLDKTLVKVVEGWRRHDQDRSDEIKLLQDEKQKAETTLHKQKEALSRVEESLNKEQKHNQELQDTNTKLEQQVSELHECVENLQRLEQKLRSDGQREREKLHTLQTETHNTQTHLQEQLQELQRQITHTTQQLERERSQVKQEVVLREEAQRRSQQLQGDLEEIIRERDSLRVERALEQARFESLKSQMEAEFRLSLEQKLNDQLSSIQEENRMLNTQLREQHRKQLLDLSARHERDLSTQLDQFRTQLQERDLKLQQHTQHYQNKLSEKQEELVSMAASKKRLEMQREELVSRLQGMMRSHWAEALKLLTNPGQIENMFVPPSWEASKISCHPEDTSRSDTHLPGAQAVVLNLSRERETQSHSDVLNYSHSFTPLEPVLDHTHLTAVSDCSALWVRPVISEEGGNSTERKMKERIPSQSRTNQSHPFTETCTNHSSRSESGLTRGGASAVLCSSDLEKAPPTKEEALPCIHEDRRNELQYYVSKLLECSPGDPLEEPIREQRSADITDPLHTHTAQQLQSFSRSGDTVSPNLEHKSDDKTEVSVFSQRAGSHVVQIRRPVGRRGGSQRVWR